MISGENLTLTALQFSPTFQLKEAFSLLQKLVKSVASQSNKPDCIVLPEYAFGTYQEWIESNRDTLDQFHQICDQISELCQRFQVAIVAGSVPYKGPEGTWLNRSHLFSKSGDLIGTYDKQHPFRTEKRLGIGVGTHTPIFQLGKFSMAILICSDLWYPAILQEISSKIDFVAVPTMTTVLDSTHTTYGRWAWHSLVAVRAKENTLPIVSADQTAGEFRQGIYTCGASCIADPSHRFSNDESPHRQALKITNSNMTGGISSTISMKAVQEYRKYRQEVGLRKSTISN